MYSICCLVNLITNKNDLFNLSKMFDINKKELAFDIRLLKQYGSTSKQNYNYKEWFKYLKQ